MEAERRSTTAKGGPRVLTFSPEISALPTVLSNCVKCVKPLKKEYVLGEEGTPESTSLLVHGWYQLETDLDLFWQQFNPEDVCGTTPVNFGSRLPAGGCVAFFVDDSQIDGVLVLAFCKPQPGDTILSPCLGMSLPRLEGFARVIRKDTILKMGTTGNTASMRPPNSSNACGKPPVANPNARPAG